MLAIAGGFGVAMEMTSSDWAAFRLTDDFGAAAGLAGLAYVANTAGMTTGRFAGDAVLASIGARRMLDGALVLTAIGLATAAFVPSKLAVIVGYVLAGMGIATLLPRLYDDAVKLPGRAGAGVGALTAGIRVSALATPLIVGSLAASSLSVGAATAFVTLPSVAGFALVAARNRRMLSPRTAPVLPR
jgi:fucose permease